MIDVSRPPSPVQEADADGSGSVDFAEFVELMRRREADKETPEDLKQAFRVFDKVRTVVLSHLTRSLILFTFQVFFVSQLWTALLN